MLDSKPDLELGEVQKQILLGASEVSPARFFESNAECS